MVVFAVSGAPLLRESDLPSTIAALLSDEGERRRLGECARAFAAARIGASATCANRIEELAAAQLAGCNVRDKRSGISRVQEC